MRDKLIEKVLLTLVYEFCNSDLKTFAETMVVRSSASIHLINFSGTIGGITWQERSTASSSTIDHS